MSMSDPAPHLTPEVTEGTTSVPESVTLVDVPSPKVTNPSLADAKNPAPNKDVDLNVEPPKEHQKPERKGKYKIIIIIIVVLAWLPALLIPAGFAIYREFINTEGKRDFPKNNATNKTTVGGLPLSVVPVNYKLKLQPDLNRLSFDGSVKIELKINEFVNLIKMNAKDLEIQEAVFKGSGGEQSAVVTLNKKKQTVDFKLPNKIDPGDGSLTVNFTGMLHDDLMGFYRSRYKVGNEVRHQAVTQFEPIDARRCFPCFDEPALKATFDVTLVVSSDRVALSNMPVKSEKNIGSNLEELTYETTPIMSSYLLAFVVGEFEYVQATSKDGTLLKVYTPLGEKESGEFALKLSIKLLTYFKEYFGIAYSLKKLDQIEIAEFEAAGMENWGLITYGKGSLLPTDDFGLDAAVTIAHEISHQWFGNLVTMEWWDDLWLNEGFATWMAFTSVIACKIEPSDFPDFDWWNMYSYIIEPVLEEDSSESSHPIRVKVTNNNVFNFDVITYKKGSTVIRMLENYIGPQTFKKGMQNYMERYQYKNTVTEDLWKVLEEASQLKVGEMMDTWTKKMGFPLLSVSVKKIGNKKRLTISQSKFTYSGNDNADYHWQIPLYYITKSNSTPTSLGLMVDKSQTYTISLPDGDWIKLNPMNVAFYRVNYASELLEAMWPAIADQSLSPNQERRRIMLDLFEVNRIGKTSVENALKTLQAYKTETDFLLYHKFLSYELNPPIVPFYRDILQEYTQSTDCLEAYKNWAIEFLRALRDSTNPIMQEWINEILAEFGEKNTVSDILKNVGNGKQSFHVYKIRLQNGGEDVLDAMFTLYSHTKDNIILKALGYVQKETLIKRVLDFAFSGDLSVARRVLVLQGLSSSRLGREMAWNFYKNNPKKFEIIATKHFDKLKPIIEGFASEDRAREVEDFYKKNPLPRAGQKIRKAVENIRLNARWLDTQMAGVKKYLKC